MACGLQYVLFRTVILISWWCGWLVPYQNAWIYQHTNLSPVEHSLKIERLPSLEGVEPPCNSKLAASQSTAVRQEAKV